MRVTLQSFSRTKYSAKMLNIVQFYSVVLVGLTCLYALFKAVTKCQHSAQYPFRLIPHICRWLLYSPFPFARFTWFEVGCICLIVGGNVAALSISVHDRPELDKRAATVAAINATLLFLGGRTNPWANFLGISLSRYYFFHGWIGRVVILKGLIHSVLSTIRSQSFSRTPLVKNVEASGYLVRTLQPAAPG